MRSFEISDDFYLNTEPIKIISGAIHYFRVVPDYWQDRLEKLKMLGCNTVETYVPWNMHEPQEGQFDFSGGLDLRKFIQTAEEVGLYVILRPAPYICAEWEFGGLPYWLLQYETLKLRFDNALYLEKVQAYFEQLFPQVIDLQITHNGPIIMMQVENEYGSYSNDHSYLNKLADMMIEQGVSVPLVTSDGPWGDMLENGTIPDRALPTINCGSNVTEHFQRLKTFHGEKKPLMVMEFWIGWFDAWGDEKHHTTNVEEAAKELDAILSEGSVNIYMFHGGTNFGFMNGANYYDKLTPDVTSYDYDALLTEWGEITPKYRAFQQVISQYTALPEVQLSTPIQQCSYGELPIQQQVSLFASLEDIGTAHTNNYPLPMEQLNQGTGYIYYTSDIGPARPVEDFRLISCNDRAQVFINEKHQLTQYDKELGETVQMSLTAADNQLGILVENMGRVNYSVKMNHQHKGIKDGVIINGAFQSGWEMFSLPMTNLHQLDFSKEYQQGVPAFYRTTWDVEERGDTFLQLDGWGKGFAVVNGFNLGRFWEKGPQKRLYIPAPVLKLGENELIIFESEGKSGKSVCLAATPDLG